MVKEGYMPNLNQVVSGGVHGVLKSIVPPVTGGAWLSMATGLSPGKTGVIDFLKRVDEYRLVPVSSADYEGRSLWDYASYSGLRVGVLNYPTLYPPYPVNGFMVSGLGSPGFEPSTWPPSLREDLASHGALYKVYVDYHLKKYNDLDLFFSDIEEHMEKYLNALKLLARSDLDLFVAVVQASDWVSHRLWAYIDDGHPLHSKLPLDDVKRTRRWFREFWSMVDEVVGVVLDRYSGDGNTVIVSDHGFGPQYGVFNLARWLVEQGFMKLRTSGFGRTSLLLKQRVLATSKKFIRILPKSIRTRVTKTGRKLLSHGIEDYVDVSISTAIALKHTIPFGSIYVLQKEYIGEVVERLTNTLKELGLQVTLWKTKKLYQGEKAELLPDIIFLIEDGRVVVLQDIKDLDKPLYTNEPYSPRHTGSHRLEGVIAAYGNKIIHKEDPIRASILDVMPTIMYLLGLPIPSNIDGNVLTSISSKKEKPRRVPLNYYNKLRTAFHVRLKLKRKTKKIR